jgi:hypothetical protein
MLADQSIKPLLHAIACTLAAFWTGCSDGTTKTDGTSDSGEAPPSGSIVDLVRFDQWEQLDASDDPYPSHRNDDHACDDKGILAEENTLEINTGDCGYALVGQPLRADLEAGDWVELMMYHSALASTDPLAEGHFSLWIGEHLYWERTMAIPSAAEVYWVPTAIDWDAEAETMVRLHLHNHGANSWRVAYLRRLRGDAVPAGHPPLRGSEAPSTSP